MNTNTIYGFSSEHYEIIAQQSSDLFIRLDANYIIKAVNPAVEKFFQTPASELINEHCSFLWKHGDLHKCDNCPVDISIKTGKYSEKSLCLQRNNQDCFIHNKSFPIFGKDETVVGIIMILTDHTDRETALINFERKLQYEKLINACQKILTSSQDTQKNKLYTLIELLSQSFNGQQARIVEINSESKSFDVQQTWQSQKEFSVEGLELGSIAGLMDKMLEKSFMISNLSMEKQKSLEKTAIKSFFAFPVFVFDEFHFFIIIESAKANTFDNIETDFISIISQIISSWEEQQIQQNRIKDLSYKMEKILDAAKITSWELDVPQEALTFHNRGILYTGKKQYPQSYPLSVLKEQDELLFKKFLQENLEEEKANKILHFVREEKWREAKIVLCEKDVEDSVKSISGILMDIDRQKKQELAVQQYAEQLEESIVQLQDTQKQLVEHEKQASLGRLVAGISHEINTPVGLALSYTTFMEDQLSRMLKGYKEGIFKRSTFEEFCQNLETSLKSSKTNLLRAGELIRSFKQVSVDQSSEVLRSFELHEYLQTILQSLNTKWKNTGHTVEIVGDTNIEMLSYPGALMQIITNLVMNTLIHGFEGIDAGNVSIRLTQKDDLVRIEYKDDGIGMSEEVLQHVFDPFFTTKLNKGGSGLGMHILHNLVIITLGGKIQCTSKVNEGVCFLIEIPREIKQQEKQL